MATTYGVRRNRRAHVVRYAVVQQRPEHWRTRRAATTSEYVTSGGYALPGSWEPLVGARCASCGQPIGPRDKRVVDGRATPVRVMHIVCAVRDASKSAKQGALDAHQRAVFALHDSDELRRIALRIRSEALRTRSHELRAQTDQVLHALRAVQFALKPSPT